MKVGVDELMMEWLGHEKVEAFATLVRAPEDGLKVVVPHQEVLPHHVVLHHEVLPHQEVPRDFWKLLRHEMLHYHEMLTKIF